GQAAGAGPVGRVRRVVEREGVRADRGQVGDRDAGQGQRHLVGGGQAVVGQREVGVLGGCDRVGVERVAGAGQRAAVRPAADVEGVPAAGGRQAGDREQAGQVVVLAGHAAVGEGGQLRVGQREAER